MVRWRGWCVALVLWFGIAALGGIACSPAPLDGEGEATSEVISEGTAGLTDGGQADGSGADGGGQETAPPEPRPVEKRASGPQKALDPGKPGPYAVGVTTLRLKDTDRLDPDTKEPRPMVIEIWYPAVDDARNTPTDAYDVNVDAPDAVKKKLKELNIQIPTLKQDAHRDAAPLRKEGPYPLILFSHGSGGIRFQSIFQTAHLASHGYVVVSADHHKNTLYDLFLDSNAQDVKHLAQAAIHRPLDVVFMLNEVKKRSKDPSDLLHQLIHFDKIGATGHSFGGMTSILVTRDIPDVSVIIPQAPHTSLVAALGVEPHHVRNVTVMVMGAKDDRTLSYQKEEKAFFDLAITEPYFGADRYLVTLERGGHFSYSNICELDLKKYADRLGFGNVDSILSDGCATHNTPIQEAHRIINHYATGLFNVLLRDSAPSSKYLTPMQGNAEVTYVHKPAP